MLNWVELCERRMPDSAALKEHIVDFLAKHFPGTTVFSTQSRDMIETFNGTGSYHFYFCASAKSNPTGAIRNVDALPCQFRISISAATAGWGIVSAVRRNHLEHGAKCTLDQLSRPQGLTKAIAASATVAELVNDPKRQKKTKDTYTTLLTDRSGPVRDASDSSVRRGVELAFAKHRGLSDWGLLVAAVEVVDVDPDTRVTLHLCDVDTGERFEVSVRQTAAGRSTPQISSLCASRSMCRSMK